MFRLRLRTVLLVVSLFVLVLPVAAVQVLRLYESALLRQTESELNAQAAFAAAAYRAAFRKLSPAAIDGHERVREVVPQGPPVTLDLARSPVHSPLPPAEPGAVLDDVARRVGAEVAPMLADAASKTGAEIRIVDPWGTVAATTGVDGGLSLARREEVDAALRGSGASRLRRTAEGDIAPVAAISRSVGMVVVVAEPIALDAGIIGAVTLWRAPPTILNALSNKWFLLLQATVLVLAVVFGIASFTARTLVLPIQRLARDAERLSAGEPTRSSSGATTGSGRSRNWRTRWRRWPRTCSGAPGTSGTSHATSATSSRRPSPRSRVRWRCCAITWRT